MVVVASGSRWDGRLRRLVGEQDVVAGVNSGRRKRRCHEGIVHRIVVVVVVVVVVGKGRVLVRLVVILAEYQRGDHAECRTFGQVSLAHVARKAARVVDQVTRADHQFVGLQHGFAFGTLLRTE